MPVVHSAMQIPTAGDTLGSLLRNVGILGEEEEEQQETSAQNVHGGGHFFGEQYVCESTARRPETEQQSSNTGHVHQRNNEPSGVVSGLEQESPSQLSVTAKKRNQSKMKAKDKDGFFEKSNVEEGGETGREILATTKEGVPDGWLRILKRRRGGTYRGYMECEIKTDKKNLRRVWTY